MNIDKEFIREAIAEVVGCDASEISDTTDFVKYLAVSSVQMLEIVAAVEDEYDVEIQASSFAKYNTIQNFVSAFEEQDK